MKKLNLVVVLFSIILTAGFIREVQAETTLKFALSAPAKTPWTAAALELARLIAIETKNAVKVNVFPGSQLGNEQDVIRQVVRGRIQIGGVSNTAASLIVPEIAVLAAPYLWSSVAQADCVLDNYMTPVFKKKFKEKGLILLGWSEVGLMGYASKKPLLGLNGLKGLKMRVAPTKASSITANTFGTNSVVLPITEVASALQTGLVEGADLPGLAFAALGIGKIAPNWLATNHAHQVGLVVMSAKTWNKFDPEVQAQIMKAQLEPDYMRLSVRAAEKAVLKKFVENGGNLVHLSKSDREKMELLSISATQELIEETGGDAKEIYQQILDAKKACS